MARKKSAETFDAEIANVKSDMSKLQDKYNKLVDKLGNLEKQKRLIETGATMNTYLKSGKSLDEIMTFLKP